MNCEECCEVNHLDEDGLCAACAPTVGTSTYCSQCGRWTDQLEHDDFGGLCVRCYDTDSPR